MRIEWEHADSLTSTNVVLRAKLELEEVEEGFVILADYQENGRGQGEHAWHSQSGKNLLMSLLIKPAFLSASRQFLISMLISLALCDLLKELGLEPMVKWPNDILTPRGKIAGILIEHAIWNGHITHSIIGMGVNLNQRDFPDFPHPATSFSLETGREVSIQKTAASLLQKVDHLYEKLRRNEAEEWKEAYRDHLWLRGEKSRFRADDQVFDAYIRGVNEFGQLEVEKDGQIQAYNHGQIAFLRQR